MIERRRDHDDCCLDMGQRVATLEANQTTIAITLRQTVERLEKISLSQAEKKGAEKIIFLLSGGALTLIGTLAEHINNIFPAVH